MSMIVDPFSVVTVAAVTWNPSDAGANISLSNGNLTATRSSSGSSAVRATVGYATGQYYVEFVLTTFVSSSNFPRVGIVLTSAAITFSPGPFGTGVDFGVYQNSPNTGYHVYNNGSQSNVGATIATGDVYGVAADFTADKIWFHRNGTYQSGDPSTATSPSYTGVSGDYRPFTLLDNVNVVTGRFTRSALTYTVPTGYLAWDGT